MEKYYKFELNMKYANIIAILFLFGYLAIIMIFDNFFKAPFGGANSLVFFIALISYFILHEICHGIGYSLYAKDKKNIKYGIVLEKGALYAMCQECLSKKGTIISLILPLLILTVIAIPIGIIFNFSWLVELGLINLAGASGDMMMLLLISKLPNDIKYIDYNNDIGAYFISKSDLSKIKTIGLKCTESGIHNENKIDKSFKRINITKISKIILIIMAIILVVSIVLELNN